MAEIRSSNLLEPIELTTLFHDWVDIFSIVTPVDYADIHRSLLIA